MARVFMYGPKWRRHFKVIEVPIADVDAATAQYYQPRSNRAKLLMFTLEDDVRELVTEEVRPGVTAQWSDPRERLGL
jgi:hypothetical protein